MPYWSLRCPTFIRKLPRLALCLALLGMAGVAAAKPADITESEMKLIPRYCPDTQGFGYGDAYSNTSPRARYWVSLMGPTFWAMHHYCWGQISLLRAVKANLSTMEKRGLLESARGDFRYVINNAPPDFVLLPEIYTKVGQVELMLDQPNRADNAFSHARALKPDYWPAYSHWVEFLMQNKHRAEALKIVRQGLENAPRSKVLREQYRILGGKAADIPKVDKPATAAKASSAQDGE